MTPALASLIAIGAVAIVMVLRIRRDRRKHDREVEQLIARVRLYQGEL